MDRESIHLIKCEYHYRFFQHNWFFLTKYNFQQQLHRWGQLESYRVRWNSERVLKFLLLLLFLFSRSVMSDSFVNLWTVARQTPLSMGFPRQEYWSGLAFLSLGDLPNPGIDPRSPAFRWSPELQVDSLLTELPEKHKWSCREQQIVARKGGEGSKRLKS